MNCGPNLLGFKLMFYTDEIKKMKQFIYASQNISFCDRCLLLVKATLAQNNK